MSPSVPWLGWIAAAGSVLLFLLATAYGLILVCLSDLSRVALRRLSGEGETGLRFLESLQQPRSTWRLALVLAHRLSLFGGVAAAAVAAGEWGLRRPSLTAIGWAVLLAVVCGDFLIARLVGLWEPRRALRMSAWLVPPARTVLFPLVKPIHLLLTGIEDGQSQDDDRDDDQEEEVEALIEVGEREGLLEAEEGEMMRGIVDLDETRIREIMTPRTDIVALPADADVAHARRLFLEAGHSRLPVYRETIDDVVGILHERDLLRAWQDEGENAPVLDHVREAMFVPEMLSAGDLLSEMRIKTHMALVVDEYGGIAGLVTLEDLLEEIVGDIRDEHDEEEALVRPDGEGAFLIDAAAHVEELEELFGLEFEGRDFDTVGGLIVSRLGRVPENGESLRIDGVTFAVTRADRRRIRQVRVERADPARGEASVGS